MIQRNAKTAFQTKNTEGHTYAISKLKVILKSIKAQHQEVEREVIELN